MQAGAIHIRPINRPGDTFSTDLHTLVIWCSLYVLCKEDKKAGKHQGKNRRGSANIVCDPTKMSVLWKYLKPQRGLIVVALVLAGIGQLLSLVDPLIFGKIIDDYALNPSNSPEEALIKGVLFWLGVAVSVAVLAQVAKAFQDYFTRLAVKKFGMQIFNDGLKQTLRLSYDEFEEQRSGETLSVLQKVRDDTQTIHEFVHQRCLLLCRWDLFSHRVFAYQELAADTCFCYRYCSCWVHSPDY